MSTNNESHSDVPQNQIIVQRNACSTIKKPKQRRRFNIAPLRLEEIKKAIEKADAESTLEYLKNSNDKNAQIDDANKENNNVVKPATQLQDSFELNFAALTLNTPAKQDVKKVEKFVSPCSDYRPMQGPKINRTLNFVTPNNKIPTKVQCSVKVQPYKNTPITKLYTVPETPTTKDTRDVSEVLYKEPDLKKIKVNDEPYIVLNQLGKGGSSEVFHCYSPSFKSHRAIKVVSLENEASAVGFINEVKMLKALQKCNRIIKMFDYEIKKEEKVLLVVLEVGGADLSKILKESAANTFHMPIYMLLYYWMEMLLAVKQIHSNGIVHADLKPANFLQVEGYLKLIDFGIASCVQSDMTSVVKSVPEGSFNYISPEALCNESSTNSNSPNFGKPKYKISFKSDVWSLGCILYQMVYRCTPFNNFSQIWLKLSKIVDPYHQIEFPTADWVPQKIVDTIKECLNRNSKLRPSVDDLIIQYESIFKGL